MGRVTTHMATCDDSEARLWCYQVRDPEISEIEEPDATIIADSKRKRSSDSCGQHEACVCSSRILELERNLSQLEARMREMVQCQIGQINATVEAALVNSRPVKKVKKSPKLRDRCCFICGGSEGSVLNRQLGVVLDDRCRKQMEVIKHGGRLTERRDMWERAIIHLNCPTAAMLAQKLGVLPVGAAENFNVQQCTDRMAGQMCTICQEPMMVGSRVQTLGCSSRHIFHHECIGSWLQTHKSCPNCREPIEPPSAEPMKPILQLCRRASGLQIPEDFDVMDLLSEENPATCTNLLGTWEKEATTTTIGTESPGSSCLTNSSSSMQSGIV